MCVPDPIHREIDSLRTKFRKEKKKGGSSSSAFSSSSSFRSCKCSFGAGGSVSLSQFWGNKFAKAENSLLRCVNAWI